MENTFIVFLIKSLGDFITQSATNCVKKKRNIRGIGDNGVKGVGFRGQEAKESVVNADEGRGSNWLSLCFRENVVYNSLVKNSVFN